MVDDRLPRQSDEFMLQRAARDADDGRFRQLAGKVAVEHGGKQLAPGEIAGGAENHQDKGETGIVRLVMMTV